MKKLAMLALIIVIGGCVKSTYPVVEGKNLSAVFFDVGQGDSSLVITPDNKKILIDCGEYNDTLVYLQAMNITEIDVLVITHPDIDHSGGCDSVIRNVNVDKILTNTNVEKDFLLDITDTAMLEVIVAYDSYGRFTGDNDNSVLLKAGYGNISFLFTGDCGWRCEKELITTEDIDVDVLKVGHHGSGHSTTAEFLEKTSPSAAVISSGAGNRYGHPANETLERLREVNAAVYRTDARGTIIITTDGSTYSVI